MRVAQIQGCPGYQAFMRRKTSSIVTGPSTLCTPLSSELRDISSALGFDVNLCHQADIISTKALLTTLKTAVESYLGTNFCFARIGLAGIEGDRVGVVKEAIQAIGLRQTLLTISAGKLAVLANMDNAKPVHEDAPYVILAVDNSSYGFYLGLYTMDEDTIVDAIKEEYYPCVNSVGSAVEEEPSHLDTLRDALQRPFNEPPANVDLPVQI